MLYPPARKTLSFQARKMSTLVVDENAVWVDFVAHFGGGLLALFWVRVDINKNGLM